jgi:hypothetical protein
MAQESVGESIFEIRESWPWMETSILAIAGKSWKSSSDTSTAFLPQLTHALVIIAYLVYLTIRAVYAQLGSSATVYDMLQVPPSIDEAGLKSAWRSLSRKYHPDKLGANAQHVDAGLWVAMREGYEVLMEPSARMAYDR